MSRLQGALDGFTGRARRREIALAEGRDRLEQRVLEIERAQRYAELILQHTTDGLALLGPDGRVLRINTALRELFGVTSPDVNQPPIVAFRHVDLESLIREAAATGASREGNLLVTHPRKRTLHARVDPIPGPDRATEGFVLHVQDMTAIRQADLMRREFVANVSHELRSPMAGLRLVAETLRGGAISDSAVARRFLDQMLVEIDRLVGLVNDLLELSRIEAGLVRVKWEKVDLGSLLDDTVAAFAGDAEAKGLALTWAVAEGATMIESDGDRLRQILWNLLDNALKYTDAGWVRMHAETTHDGVAIRVADSGPGIPRDDLPRVFERFYRVDRSRAQTTPGTGLGLSIVKHLTELLGGRVELTSQEGRGTTFSVILPLSPRTEVPLSP